LRKNNLAELAPRFGSYLAAPIEQNQRNSTIIVRILRLRSDQRWPEDGMQKCKVILRKPLISLDGERGVFILWIHINPLKKRSKAQ